MVDVNKNKEINNKLSDLYIKYSQDFLSAYIDAFEEKEPLCRINEFGIVDENRYDTDNGVLVIAKETNNWNNEEFKEGILFRGWMNNISKTGLPVGTHIKRHPTMWYNMGRWLMTVENPNQLTEDLLLAKQEAISKLGTMAFTNINKVRGGSSSRKQYNKVAYSEIAGHVLRKEIRIIKPKIIMCCGTWRVVNYHLNYAELENSGCKVLCMPHPADFKSSKRMIEELKQQMSDGV